MGNRSLLTRIHERIAARRRRATMQRYFGASARDGHVEFLDRGALFVDPTDNRGSWVLAASGVTQPLITQTWRTMAESWHPDVAVDVGANYGEISLSARYAPHARIVLVEANPRLLPFLKRSCASHRNAAQIEVLEVFAGPREEMVSFTVDEKWSGTSSAVLPIEDAAYKGEGPARSRTMTVSCIPLDKHLLPLLQPTDQRLLAKIDVEGAEMGVLAGLTGTLAKVPEWVLIVEHNPTALAAGGVSTAQASDTYHALGTVFAWTEQRALRRVQPGEDVGTGSADIVICSRNPETERVVADLRPPAFLR